MSYPSRDQYLENKVLTASQPQLHLMLLDGALRYGRQAQTMLTEESTFSETDHLLARMCDIVDELAHGASAGKEEVSAQLAEQYAFIYRELISSRFNEDPGKLDSCVKLLAYQQETWRLACEKMETEASAPVAKPHLPAMHLGSNMPTQSVSFEA